MWAVQFEGSYSELNLSIARLKGSGRGDKEGHTVIELDEPQKAVAPGQVAAIWDQSWCLGCGVIESAR